MSDPNTGGVHAVCDAYVDDAARLDPLWATMQGVVGHDDELPDLSPDGHRARAELARRALSRLAATQATDASERAAKAVFAERVGLDVEMHDAGLAATRLNTVVSPAQEIREVFDLMPTDTTEDWAAIARRLSAVPATLQGYRRSLHEGADRRIVAARRQVRAVSRQCRTWSGDGGTPSFFASMVEQAEVPDALRADLDRAAAGAAEAYRETADFLRDELDPLAVEEDAVGRDVYRLWSRSFTGADLDLDDAYAWGWDEFRRVESELAQAAARVLPGASPAEAAAALDRDDRYRVTGRAAFQDWVQGLADQTLAAVRGVHFDISDELMVLDCRIAPPGGSEGAYYTGPAADFSRPGRLWWSVAPDRHTFATWRNATTVYHEGAPGHHLQIGTALASSGLSRFQQCCFVPGHGEGWALYAERLMQEFGAFDDGELVGMLDKSLFRAARVVVDIGMHLGLRTPAGSGFHEGARWTPELGAELLRTRTLAAPSYVADEIDRYLGWPGQAPSYKLGERLWFALRDEASAGGTLEPKDFHMRALRCGPAGLDTMRTILARA